MSRREDEDEEDFLKNNPDRGGGRVELMSKLAIHRYPELDS